MTAKYRALHMQDDLEGMRAKAADNAATPVAPPSTGTDDRDVDTLEHVPRIRSPTYSRNWMISNSSSSYYGSSFRTTSKS